MARLIARTWLGLVVLGIVAAYGYLLYVSPKHGLFAVGFVAFMFLTGWAALQSAKS